jgi:hypothetical protein
VISILFLAAEIPLMSARTPSPGCINNRIGDLPQLSVGSRTVAILLLLSVAVDAPFGGARGGNDALTSDEKPIPLP